MDSEALKGFFVGLDEGSVKGSCEGCYKGVYEACHSGHQKRLGIFWCRALLVGLCGFYRADKGSIGVLDRFCKGRVLWKLGSTGVYGLLSKVVRFG